MSCPLQNSARSQAGHAVQPGPAKTASFAFKLEYDGGQVLAANEAVKVGKLIQIACGVAYGADGEDIFIPSQSRTDELLELVEESEGKAIVFVPLTGALRHAFSAAAVGKIAAMESCTVRTCQEKSTQQSHDHSAHDD